MEEDDKEKMATLHHAAAKIVEEAFEEGCRFVRDDLQPRIIELEAEVNESQKKLEKMKAMIDAFMKFDD